MDLPLSGPELADRFPASAGNALSASFPDGMLAGAAWECLEMAIGDSRRSEIWRLCSVDGLPTGAIARLLGLHRSTADRAIADRGRRSKAKIRKRASKLDAFGGIPRSLPCDNPESAAVGRCGKAVELSATATAMLDRYGSRFKPAGVRRGSEKGRAERSIRNARDNFWPARARRDLDDLNG